jgi:glycine betaine catabolism B
MRGFCYNQNSMKAIDNFLDKITMYRLMLCYLIFLIGGAIFYSGFEIFPFSPIAILYTTLVLILLSSIFNKIFSYILKVPTNVESVYITSLILSLIITPPDVGEYLSIFPFLLAASFLAVASKFLLNINNKHIFNPAAIAVFICTYAIGQSASWWVATAEMLPLILLGGILITRKLRQFHLIIPFLLASTFVATASFPIQEEGFNFLKTIIPYSPMFFFGFVMLTEPLTMPYLKKNRIFYGILIGILFNQFYLNKVYFSPEAALLVGNIFAYIINPKRKFVFIIKEIYKVSEGVLGFILNSNKEVNNKAGQYMEWTLPAVHADNRGNRRYFTIASSPTEQESQLGVKFYPSPSSFKKTLFDLKVGDKIIGGQLSGDFVLPQDKNKKLAFLAGGIGVTPFRSMIKYLIDKKEKRNIVMVYSNRTQEEIAYKEIFKEGESIGARIIYTLSETEKLTQDWMGEKGFIDEEMIRRQIPDFIERTFYISGSHNMVTTFQDILKKMGVKKSQIKTDFFPGLV